MCQGYSREEIKVFSEDAAADDDDASSHDDDVAGLGDEYDDCCDDDSDDRYFALARNLGNFPPKSKCKMLRFAQI